MPSWEHDSDVFWIESKYFIRFARVAIIFQAAVSSVDSESIVEIKSKFLQLRSRTWLSMISKFSNQNEGLWKYLTAKLLLVVPSISTKFIDTENLNLLQKRYERNFHEQPYLSTDPYSSFYRPLELMLLLCIFSWFIHASIMNRIAIPSNRIVVIFFVYASKVILTYFDNIRRIFDKKWLNTKKMIWIFDWVMTTSISYQKNFKIFNEFPT